MPIYNPFEPHKQNETINASCLPVELSAGYARWNVQTRGDDEYIIEYRTGQLPGNCWSGERLEWSEEADDWEGEPITPKEAEEIARYHGLTIIK